MAGSAATGATLGVFASALAAILGYLGVRARNRTDGAGTLVNAGIALATFETGQRHEVERKLDAALARIDELEAAVETCERERRADRALLGALAAKAGVPTTSED